MLSLIPQKMLISDLCFDLQNPRLVDFDLPITPDEAKIIEILWKTMDVRELMMSIAASGFFQHEPLIVTKEKGQNIVIEGNRRLAAVKILLNPSLLAISVANLPYISDDRKKEINQLPIIIGTREDAWRYIGFKHVNGPAKWSSYAKSQYIAKVHQEYSIALEEIANQIGDRHKTVQRLFRGMMVIQQAEAWRIFAREDRWRNHFSFSHLYTGLDYPGISAFLGLKDAKEEDDAPVPPERKSELKEFCLWLYGSRRDRIPPVIESQNPDLRHLNEVLNSRPALSSLRAGDSLSQAFELSRPSSNIFEESLFAAERSLQKARGLLSTAYDGSGHLLKTADNVLQLAEDLYAEMQRKRRPFDSTTISGDRLMFKWPASPSPFAPFAELADFIELVCWQQQNTSSTALIQLLGRIEEVDLVNGRPEEDQISTQVEEAFYEIDKRIKACNNYPFELIENGLSIQIRSEPTGNFTHFV